MADFLMKEKALFARNAKGELLPIEMVLKASTFAGKTVSVIPCTIGDWDAYRLQLNDKGEVPLETDWNFVVQHLVQPSFTKEEVKDLPPILLKELVMTIMSTTGLMKERNAQTELEAREKK